MQTRLTKQRIRSKILLKLTTQKEEDRKRKSRFIEHKLFRTKEFIKAKIIMFYIAFGGEVDTKEMIEEALRLGKIVVVPVCKKNRVALRPCILEENSILTKGPYGVCQPARGKVMSKKDLDLVIVPGLAFDEEGNRLGRGKGCYDHFLKNLPEGIPSIGLAFNFQILPKIPATERDIRIQKLIFA